VDGLALPDFASRWSNSSGAIGARLVALVAAHLDLGAHHKCMYCSRSHSEMTVL
jgi:hypothetical protein